MGSEMCIRDSVVAGLATVTALLLPERTEDPTHYRIIYTIWATTLLMIPAIGCLWFSNLIQKVRIYWMLLWTATFLVYLTHFYFAVVVHFGGVSETFTGQGFGIALGNFILTSLWAIDVVLMWSATRHDYRIWNRHLAIQMTIALAFVFFAAIRNDGIVRWIGIALGITMATAPLVRLLIGSKLLAKDAPEADGANDLPNETFLGGTSKKETQLFHRFIKDINLSQRRSKDRSKASKIRRALHAKKQLGVTAVRFVVMDGIPEELRHGLFKEPMEFTAAVRLSNAASSIEPDGKKDLRGFALRVFLDDANAHDFLGTNFPSSHARDAYQFMSLIIAVSKPFRILIPLRLAFRIGPIETVRMIIKLLTSRSICKSLLTESYWSRSPILLGRTAVRYKITGRNTLKSAPKLHRANFLREEIVAQLQDNDLVFDFMVQQFVDRKRTPIEDSSIEWSEAVAKPIKVAEIVIPRQNLNTPQASAMERSVERFEFNPWRTSTLMRPLGSQNRARRLVYSSSKDFRLGRKDVARRPFFMRLLLGVSIPFFSLLNRWIPWHKLPMVWLELLNLDVIRHLLREKNLHDMDPPVPLEPSTLIETFDSSRTASRQSDGTCNDLTDPEMGKAGAIFGRNTPFEKIKLPSENSVLSPSPREISRRLLARDSFKPATTLNVLAASWIQFMIHGWFNHTKLKGIHRCTDFWDVPLASDDPWLLHSKKMLIPKTKVARRATGNKPAAYANTETHWWDGSQIYGNSLDETNMLRANSKGYMQLDADRRLPIDDRIKAGGIELTGFNDNWWLGLSMLHTLFVWEHNAICDRLAGEFPNWDDEQLFQTARLVNAALMAKIHTVEWTPGILGRRSLQVSMDANWWGVLGEQFTNAFGRVSETEEKSGILGSATDHHSAPYAFTEEFVSVYRMHPLMPDDFSFHSHQDHSSLCIKTLPEITGQHTRLASESLSNADLFYSFGVSHPGAITLRNFPNSLREFQTAGGFRLDLATVDNLRDRERAIPRYNDFRRSLRMKPIRKWADITSDPEMVEEIRDIYAGDLEQVDTLVGLLAETPPDGFGFSDTAFRVFVLMASRRLKSDRFYTNDFNVHMYSKPGLDWIRDNEMSDVILRHLPELKTAIAGVGNAFAPWRVASG